MVRAAQLTLAAAALMMNSPAWAQSSSSPRPPTPRAPQQNPNLKNPTTKKPATKPPVKKPAPPKKAKVKVAPPAGVVIPRGQDSTPLGPAFSASANAQRDITEALVRAKSENRRVLILWGMNRSDGCLRLNALIRTDPALQKLMLYEYELVLVDVGARDRNLDIALSYGVAPQASGVPWLTVLNADAEPICNLHADRFKDGKSGYDAAKLAEYLRGYQAMYPAADSLLNAALTSAQASEHLLLLQFAAPTCARCGQLEQWFERSEVEAILSRNFTRQRIDVDRTVGGRDVLRRFSKAWATSIPWFALVNAKSGEVIATSDGLDGQSIAALDSENAVRRFGELLVANATTITPEEIDWLMKSLKQMNNLAGDDSAVDAPAATQPAAQSNPADQQPSDDSANTASAAPPIPSTSDAADR